MATEAETYAALAQIFEDVFDGRDILLSPTLSSKEVPEWDSFKQIDIVLACEAKASQSLWSRRSPKLYSLSQIASS